VYHLTATARRARWSTDGELLALVADGESPLDFLAVPEGGTPLTTEQITAAVGELDPDDLDALIEAALAEAEGIDPQTATSATVERIVALGDAVDAARARQQQIADEAAQQQQAAADALARLRGPGEGDEGDGEGDEGDGEGDGEGEPEGEPEGQPQGEPQAVTASARTGSTTSRRRTTALPRPGTGMRTGATEPAPTGGDGGYSAPRASNTLVAAAGLDSAGFTTGQAIADRRQLGVAFGHRLEQIRRGRGADGDQLAVVTVQTAYPEDRQLGSNVDTNTARIDAATSREALVAAGQAAAAGGALVAAGGLCGPIEQLNDVPVLGSTARPVRDALANFGADRGGVQWREHLSFGDFAGAVGFWTLDDDEAVTGDPATEPKTKPCLVVECPGQAEAYVEAITLCLEFSNVTSRFDPEGTAANIAAAQIAHARIAENRLLAQIGALSTTVTGGEVLGAVRDLLTFLDHLIAQYRSFYRLDDAIALHMVLPLWVRNMIRADLTRGMAGDLEALAVAEARIAGWFQARGVNITYHLDGLPARVAAPGVAPAIPAQVYGAFTPGGAVAAFPASIEALLWVEGDMLHLDGGTLDLGVVRDSSLNTVNRYKTFSESWEGVAHRGVEAIRGVVTTRPLGMVAGTADTAAILAA